MTIKEIIKNKYVTWKDVKRAIKYHYPSDKNNYEDLFNYIAKKRVSKVNKGEWLVIEGGYDYYNKEFKGNIKEMIIDELLDKDIREYYSVSLKVDNDTTYAVSFIPWSKMINYPIHIETLKHLTLIEIVAHFLWEITFYGNEKQMKKTAKGLNDLVKEIEKDLK